MPPSPNQGSEPMRQLAAEDYILLIHDQDPNAVAVPLGIFTNPDIPDDLKRETIARYYDRVLEAQVLGAISQPDEPYRYGYWDMFCDASMVYKTRALERAKWLGSHFLNGLIHSDSSGAAYAKHRRIK